MTKNSLLGSTTRTVWDPRLSAALIVFTGLFLGPICALAPVPNLPGLLPGVILIAAGAWYWVRCRDPHYRATLAAADGNLLAGLLWWVVALVAGLGLGPSAMRANTMFVILFVAVGVMFGAMGLRQRRQWRP